MHAVKVGVCTRFICFFNEQVVYVFFKRKFRADQPYEMEWIIYLDAILCGCPDAGRWDKDWKHGSGAIFCNAEKVAVWGCWWVSPRALYIALAYSQSRKVCVWIYSMWSVLTWGLEKWLVVFSSLFINKIVTHWQCRIGKDITHFGYELFGILMLMQ